MKVLLFLALFFGGSHVKTEEVKETVSGMKLPFWETREAAFIRTIVSDKEELSISFGFVSLLVFSFCVAPRKVLLWDRRNSA